MRILFDFFPSQAIAATSKAMSASDRIFLIASDDESGCPIGRAAHAPFEITEGELGLADLILALLNS
jgi:hypothetical protein